jgi:hypothetical protein
MNTHRRADADAQRGSVTAFVVITTMALLFIAGLVIDGGLLLTTQRQAINEAEHAARAGAQALSEDALRATGAHLLDPVAAASAAQTYLARIGRTGTVAVSADRVSVTVEIPHRLLILGLAGLRTVTVTGQAQARNVRGLTHGET